MIAVVADDLTGAAELAGIAWRFGLTAEVQTRFDPTTDAEFIALDVDSRDVDVSTAVQRTSEAFHEVIAAKPALIFKKCDSILRGHVPEEIEAALAATKLPRALLIPANPSRGRVIFDGMYFVEGKPLAETSFRHDPHYPRLTSSVEELLSHRAVLVPHDDPLVGRGIFVPEMTSASQMDLRVRQLDKQTLAVGGADFFATLLAYRHGQWRKEPRPEGASIARPALMLCCSAMAWTGGRAEECRHRGVPVLEIEGRDNWQDVALRGYNELARTPMIMVGNRGRFDAAAELLEELPGALEVATELTSMYVPRILIEGGGTARAFLNFFPWKRYRVCREFAPGVVELRVREKPWLTAVVKVGSYPWPEEIWPSDHSK